MLMDEKHNYYDKQGDLIDEWEANCNLDVFKFHLSSVCSDCEQVDNFNKWKLTDHDWLGFGVDILLGYVQAMETRAGVLVQFYSTKGFDKDRPVFSEQGEVEQGRELPLPIERIAKDLKKALESDTEKKHHDSGHFQYGIEDRRRIVGEYHQARERGEATNKNAWAKTQYGITGKTLLGYEREFPEGET